MTFFFLQGGVVTSSQITHTLINIQPLARILEICAFISSSSALFTVYPNRIMYRHLTPLQVITTRAREGGPKGHKAKQKWPRETHSVTYVPGLSPLSNLLRIVAKPPPSFLCCPRPHSHHPSSLSSVSIVPALHFLPPSTPFWPDGTHPFFSHGQTISILSDLLSSLTPFLFQLSYALNSKLYPFVTLQQNFSNTISQEHSVSFSQHVSYPMPLLRTTPLVQLLLNIDASWN